VVLVLVGLALFLVDLSVTNHGLPTAGAIVALLAEGMALLVAGVPYSGVLLGAIAVVAVLMGGVLFGVLRSSRALRRRPAMTGREGMIGELGEKGRRREQEDERLDLIHLRAHPRDSHRPSEHAKDHRVSPG
jgi:membrane-bound ClpP family serine protease